MLCCRLTKLLCLPLLSLAFVLSLAPKIAESEDPVQPTVIDTAEVPVKKKVVLTFVRRGGFAGFSDDLSIYSDQTFEKKGPRHRPKLGKKGKLTADQQTALKKLLTTFGEVKWSRGNAPNVADGMQEAITISGTGKTTKLDPRSAEFRHISKLANELLRPARK